MLWLVEKKVRTSLSIVRVERRTKGLSRQHLLALSSFAYKGKQILLNAVRSSLQHKKLYKNKFFKIYKTCEKTL